MEKGKFEFNEQDLHNLYDLLYLITDDCDYEDTLQANNTLDWFQEFFSRLDKVVIPG